MATFTLIKGKDIFMAFLYIFLLYSQACTNIEIQKFSIANIKYVKYFKECYICDSKHFGTFATFKFAHNVNKSILHFLRLHSSLKHVFKVICLIVGNQYNIVDNCLLFAYDPRTGLKASSRI